MEPEERLRIAGAIAGVSAVVFAIPHFWYYFGISLTFPGDFPATLPYDNVLLVVGGISLLAAAYAIGFTRLSFVRRLPEPIVTLPAWLGGTGLTLWGLAFFGVQIQLALGWLPPTSQYAVQNANPNAIWGYYWYSLFFLWGVSLVAAAYYYHKLKRSRTQADHR